jgi:hypothetical protein
MSRWLRWHWQSVIAWAAWGVCFWLLLPRVYNYNAWSIPQIKILGSLGAAAVMPAVPALLLYLVLRAR